MTKSSLLWLLDKLGYPIRIKPLLSNQYASARKAGVLLSEARDSDMLNCWLKLNLSGLEDHLSKK